MSRYLYIFSILAAPQISEAATSVQGLLTESSEFISGTLIVFLFGFAFLFVVINVFRYFILGGADQEGQKKAKALAVYGVAAFVFLTTFYGIVNLLTESTGLAGEGAPPSDFFGLGDWNGGGGDDDNDNDDDDNNQALNIEAEALISIDGNQTVGQSIVLKGTVRNVGIISASGFSSAFSYCWKTTEGGCDFSVLSSHNVDSLESGLSEIQPSNSLSLTQAGTLRVKYCVDSGNTIEESNEDDNCIEMEYEIGGGGSTSNINIETIELIRQVNNSPGSDGWFFNAMIRNTGTISVSGISSVFSYCWIDSDDCNFIDFASFDELPTLNPEGEQIHLGPLSQLTQAGTLRVKYCVDPGNAILESNEDDNCIEMEYEIEGGGSTSNLNIKANGIAFIGPGYAFGNNISIVAGLNNFSYVDVSNFNNEFSYCWLTVDGTCNFEVLNSSTTILSLPAREGRIVEADFLLVKAGTLRVKFCVDTENVLVESNENDNCFEKEMILNNNIITDSITGHVSDQRFSADVVIKNEGVDTLNIESGLRYCWLTVDGTCDHVVSAGGLTKTIDAGASVTKRVGNSYLGTRIGKIKFWYCVDPRNLILEYNEIDNCREATLDVEGDPNNDVNLIPSTPFLTSGYPYKDTNMVFTATTTILGSGTADSGSKSVFYYKWESENSPEMSIGIYTESELNEGDQVMHRSETFSPNRTGNLTIKYCVDYTYLIDETNEYDNCVGNTFNIINYNGVDLRSNSLPQHLGTATRGNSVTFAGRVTNGQTEINNEFKSVFKYCWGDGCLPNTSMDFMEIYAPLESNENRPIGSGPLILQQSGKLRVRLCVDNTNLINEIDETNNCSSIKTIDVAEN